MTRLRSVLFLLVLGACAHESAPPRDASSNSVAGAIESRVGSSHPMSSAELAPGDRELATRFQSSPALTTLQGEASYYSDGLAGHATASGEPYQPQAYTAAHRKLPLGTVLRITRSDGGAVVYVRVNDRGPYGSKRRILDLSRAAAEQLGMLRAGVLQVRAEVVAYGEKRAR